MATRTALSSYEMYWYPWDDEKEMCWVRSMPEYDYVITLENNAMTTYRYKMHQEDLVKQLFMVKQKRRVIEQYLYHKDIHGNPIPNSYLLHYHQN